MHADHLSKITDEYLADLERAHGRIKHVVYNGVDLVFRKPKRHECKDHAIKLENPQSKVDADEQLAQLLVVRCGDAEGKEARQAFLSLLDDYPYLARNEAVGGALAKLTGVVQDADAKRYGNTLEASGVPQPSTPKA